MTARFGGAFGRGYTSKGESVAELPSEGRSRAQKERIRAMARKNEQDAYSATPGASGPGTHAVEEPLNVGGTRDALIEDGKGENDYIPEVESKGYHVGMVRQPAKVVVNEAGQAVGFASELPSKFADQPTIDDLKAHHNEVESSDEWNEDVAEATQVTLTPEQTEAAKAALDERNASAPKASSRRGAKGKTVGDELREAASEG
jgi:hypothetical protein